MNCYAYPLIVEAMKSSFNNFLSVELYNREQVYIYRKHNLVHVRSPNGQKTLTYEIHNFNYFNNKPIEKVTIVYDKLGSMFRDIYNKEYSRAAITIQQAWKNKKLIN